MKKYLFLLVLMFVFSCNSEDASDCFQTSGTVIQTEIEKLDSFTAILVNRDVELIITQDEFTKVVVETGDNLLNDIDVKVTNGRLVLTDNNTCNYTRDFGITKVYVTAPNITEIRSSTQYDISSNGILAFDSLNLVSEDFNEPDTFIVGDFKMAVNTNQLTIVSNGLSFFYIEGQTEHLNVNFAAGMSRFEGESLIAQNVSVFHRGQNDMIVNPQQSITGQLVSVGNVVAKHRPNVIDIEALFSGRLIFDD